MALSKNELENFRQEAQKSKGTIATKPKNNKKIIIFSAFSLIIVLILAGVSFSFYQSNKPGQFDNLAKCLADKGAVMFGASFCKYTAAQKGMFGNSMKFIDYRDFTEDSNIKITPTWLINGKYYENAQSFDRLSAITGCIVG